MNRNNFLKTLTVHLISLSLTFAPLPLFAASEDEKGVQVNNSEWVGNIGGILGQVSSTVMQSQQKQFAMRQQAALLQGSRPQVVPAKFFPQCRIAPAGAKIPQQACKPSGNPMQSVQQAQTFQTIAQQNIDFYDQLLDEAQNAALPSGIACLKQAMDGVGSSVQDRINGLERMKEQIAKSNQLFEEQNKKILEDIKRNGNVLLGAERGKKIDVNLETAEFDKLMSPECKDIIVNSGNATVNSQVFRGGLLGIRDGALSSLNVKATNLQSNYGSYKKDLDAKIIQMKKDIKDYGLEGFLDQNGGQSGSFAFERNGQKTFGSLKNAFTDKANQIATKIADIKKNIRSEVGGTSTDLDSLMRMDQNFRTDFAKFADVAESQLKREKMSQCITGADSGVSLSTDQILAGLRYDTTALTGNTLANYRSALKYILDDTQTTPETKKTRIKELDAKFQGRVVIVNSAENSTERTMLPYQMFQQIVANCEAVIDEKNDDNVGRSTADKIKRAKTYMRDLQKLERTFASEMSNHILSEVQNCSGRGLDAGQCGEEAMDPSNGEFCLSQASTCADQANRCYGQINQEVKKRQDNMNSLATVYNNNVAALITSQEALLGQVKAQVQRDAEFFKSFFPGANYAYPESLFVKMPQLSEFGSLGVELRGGGDIETLKKLPEEIAKLQGALKEQWEGGAGGKGIANVIDEYIKSQAQAMENNRGKWEGLLSECQNTEAQSVAAIQKQNQKAQKEYGEKAEKLGEFCSRFDALKDTNPAAGCNDDYDVKGLYKDSMKVSAHVNDDAIRFVRKYQEMCAQSQNESEKGTEALGDSKNGEEYILSNCDVRGSDQTLKQALSDIQKVSGISDTEKQTISAATDVSSAEITKIVEANKENKELITAIENYIALNKKSTEVKEKIKDAQKPEYFLGMVSRSVTDENIKKAIAARAAELAKKSFKEDSGFCMESKLDALSEIVGDVKEDTGMLGRFKQETSKTENNRPMQAVGRSIASLSNSAQGGATSDFGQADYSDIECAAAATPGRFGAGDFSSFDQSILGPNASAILGLGK
ncbi:MAG: hypothetical protein ACJAT2_000845 [Bacteriovoracaceae bacterium]|jgi:hypothetical protein